MMYLVEYYEHITKNMVGKVLTQSRGITKDKNQYSLKGFDGLSEIEISELINLCHSKIEEFLGKRGDKVWNHRRKSSGYISGTLRYEISNEQSSDANSVAYQQIENQRPITFFHNSGGMSNLTPGTLLFL